MIYENFFKDMFESIPDYRKIVLILFLIKTGEDLLKECGFLKSDFNRLFKEYENNLMEQNGEYLDHIKNLKEAVIEQFPDK